MKHASISIFVPHLACPNDCIFCNQRKISGTKEPTKNIHAYLLDALQKLPAKFTEVDIAFFGGSFTGIEENQMRAYLAAANEIRTKNNRITGIRLSTRPDYISEKILNILDEYHVTAIELGVQSMYDSILQKANRGHTVQQIIDAIKIIQKRNYELILQFMPGLPGDTDHTILFTAKQIAALSPDGVRIYPCVVIKGTKLEKLWMAGQYKPLQTDKAVELCAQIVRIFREKHIKILRIGLHSSDLIQTNSVAAGPFHPAFGELVSQKLYLDTVMNQMKKKPPITNEILWVAPNCTSKMVGNKKNNIKQLEQLFHYHFIVKEKKMDKDMIERSAI